MIVGAFAAQAFGVTRSTFDVDIVVNLNDDQIVALAERFPPPRYYADIEMMKDSMRRGLMCNVIDSAAGVKADLVPVGLDPEAQTAFGRRIRRVIGEVEGQRWEVWCAQPTDIIIAKLRAWMEGRSNKQADDIYSLLAFALSGLSNNPVDVAAITEAATRMGDEASRLWKGVIARAERDTRATGTT
jgi:hypothetical protein